MSSFILIDKFPHIIYKKKLKHNRIKINFKSYEKKKFFISLKYIWVALLQNLKYQK